MQTHNLKRNTNNRKAKQVGRGGTRGKTSGRGTKGQNARSGRKKRPEMRDIIKRYPKLRGRGKNFLKSIQSDSIAVKTSILDSKFANGEAVNPKSLSDKGIINKVSGKLPTVKIVAGGPVAKKLVITLCEISAGARSLVEKAGGSIA